MYLNYRFAGDTGRFAHIQVCMCTSRTAAHLLRGNVRPDTLHYERGARATVEIRSNVQGGVHRTEGIGPEHGVADAKGLNTNTNHCKCSYVYPLPHPHLVPHPNGVPEDLLLLAL